jgi:hypothetical protein
LGICKIRKGLHDDGRSVDILLDGLVGQNGAAIDVDLVANGDIVTQYCDVLKPGPFADSAVPTDNSRLDPGVILDAAVLQNDTSLKTYAITDNDVGANGDVGANTAVFANLCGRVNQNVAAIDKGLRRGCEELRVLAGQRREVQAGAGEKVLGLSDIHPEALEIERVKEAILDNGRERLLFDGCGAELDTVKHAGVEDVDAGIDAVADKLDGLLDEAVNQRRVTGLVYHDTVLGRLLDLGHDDGALAAMLLVELGELLEGVVAGDVGVEDEEGRVVLAEDALGELERASGAQGLGFDGELDLDVVLLLVLHSRVSRALSAI